MKKFTDEFIEALKTLAKPSVTERELLSLKHLIVELNISIFGYADISQTLYHQKNRWDEEAKRLSVYRDQLEEKIKEKEKI